MDRRDFIRTAAIAGAGLTLGADRVHAAGIEAPQFTLPGAADDALFRSEPLERVRIGFVGVGHQGTGHVQNFLRIENVDIVAICDIVPEHVQRAQKLVTDAGRRQPVGYSRGTEDFRRMIDTEQPDLVFTATPWEWHAPVMLHAMRNGSHAATEVPMGVSLDELWELVETAESTRRHCVMMENCCYDRTEMMILNMVRQGRFFEIPERFSFWMSSCVFNFVSLEPSSPVGKVWALMATGRQSGSDQHSFRATKAAVRRNAVAPSSGEIRLCS